MTHRPWQPQGLDAVLEAWKREMLPDRFPDLAEPAPEPAVLTPACWDAVRQVWSGTTWRRYVDPCWGAWTGRVG